MSQGLRARLGKDENTRCVVVVTLVTDGVSCSAPRDFGALWEGGRGLGTFHHLGLWLPVEASIYLAMMHGCQLWFKGPGETRWSSGETRQRLRHGVGKTAAALQGEGPLAYLSIYLSVQVTVLCP